MNLGFVAVGSTVRLLFTTHAQTGAAVAPNSAFEAADVILYKDGSATQRTSQAGWTMTSPFDSITGLHQLAIDLSDNTDAGFYAAGSSYVAVLSPDETVDGLATVRVIGWFTIGVAPANVTQFGGSAGTFSGGRPEVNVTHEEGVALGTPGPLPKRGITDFGTAQSASSTGVVLRSAAAFANDVLIGSTIYAHGSDQGYWQDRVITDNALTGDAVTVDAWTVTPTGTITYIIFAAPPVASNNGLATAAALSTVEGKVDTIDSLVDGLVAAIISLATTTGAVTTDGGNSATSFETNLAQTTNDYWKDSYLLITSGALIGQQKKITAYNGTTKIITVSGGFTGTPADGVTFAIVNR